MMLQDNTSINLQRLAAQLIILACFCFTLTSCHTVYPTHQTSIQQSMNTLREGVIRNQQLNPPRYHYAYRRYRPLPSDINSTLLPPLSHYVNPARQTEPRFDVNANNVPAKEFFMGLVAGSRYNMIVHPNINGTISMDLKNVTIRQVMDAVRDIYGYEYHKTSYGYEVLPPELETQLFHINYLDVQRSGRSYTQLTTGQVSNKVGTVTVGGTSNYNNPTPTIPSGTSVPEGLGTISSIETKSEMQFWKNIENAIQGMLGKGDGHNVTVNAQTGVISVRAYPAELHRIANYINTLESSLNRQVILEAKILEVDLDDSFQAGIDWGILNNPALIDPTTGQQSTGAGMGQAANASVNGTDLTQLNGIFAFRVNGNFKLLINLLQTQGNVQVLSSPHISTVNNQKAVIKVGSDEFFVTGVSTSNTIIGTNTIPSQDVSLTPFFSGVTLDVTPEISRENEVVLHIHPSVSRVTQQTKTIGLGSTGTQANNLVLPLAFSTIRESDNIVKAKNGQVIVIGGLMQNNMREVIAATPWISKVPFIGFAFRRTEQVSSKSELVILLRPIIANNCNEIKMLDHEKKTFQIFKRPFHAGALPRVFGNEAEREDRND